MKAIGRHIDVVATVQVVSGRCSVHVRVTEVVATKEQVRLIRQMTVTTTNRCISLEPGDVHTVHISFHMHIPNGPSHEDTNFVTPL